MTDIAENFDASKAVGSEAAYSMRIAKTIGILLVFAGFILFFATAGHKNSRVAQHVATNVARDLLTPWDTKLSIEMEKPPAFGPKEFEGVRNLSTDIRTAKSEWSTKSNGMAARDLDSLMFETRDFYVKRAERNILFELLPFFVFAGMVIGLGLFLVDEGRCYGDAKRRRPVVLFFGSLIASIVLGAWVL